MLPTRHISCPYCGESIELIIDDSVDHQHYIEDCSVCCRPIEVDITVISTDEIQVMCTADNEA
jgi:hypothetical protein